MYIFVTMLMAGTGALYAQAPHDVNQSKETKSVFRGDLKGPKAKHFKHWKYETTPAVHVLHETKQVLKGPDAKNKKTLTETKPTDRVVVRSNNARKGLKGPAAKNYKPWNNQK